MDIKNFVLSYYKNSADDFHIQKVEKAVEAQKPHTHAYFQIYYIAKGSLMHFVENESSLLSHGDMFIVPPETVHFIKPDKDTIFYSLSFMPEFLGESSMSNRLVINFLRSFKNDKYTGIRPKISVGSKDIFYIETIMEHILNEFNEKPIGFDETIRAYAVVLITVLARGYFEESNASLPTYFENNRLFVLHCVEYIENNFTDNITLEEMSKRSAMSKANFCSLFYELTGYSFNRYLNLCRIKKATEYINQGYKITAVYGLCGYNDFSTFYRNFKKIMGISPNEYKASKKG